MKSYKNNIVKKPWGYEYLVYQNKHVALWFLYLKYTHSTSLHCHPNKTTGLILLDGEAEVSFFNRTTKLVPTQKVMIRKGLFHTTKATSEKGAFIFEIETPADKEDIVRFRDSYGREGKPYEDHTHETSKQKDCLWITNTAKKYDFANCTLEVRNVNDVSVFKKIDDSLNIVFLKGGILSDYGQYVAGAGDITVASTVKQLIEVFKKVKDLVIMVVRRND